MAMFIKEEEPDEEYLQDPLRLSDCEESEMGETNSNINDVEINDAGCADKKSETNSKELSVEYGLIRKPIFEIVVHEKNIDQQPTNKNENELLVKLIDNKKHPAHFKEHEKYVSNENSNGNLKIQNKNFIKGNDLSDDCQLTTILVNNVSITRTLDSKEDCSSFSSANSVLVKNSFEESDDKVDFKKNKGLVGMTITRKIKMKKGKDINKTPNKLLNAVYTYFLNKDIKNEIDIENVNKIKEIKDYSCIANVGNEDVSYSKAQSNEKIVTSKDTEGRLSPGSYTLSYSSNGEKIVTLVTMKPCNTVSNKTDTLSHNKEFEKEIIKSEIKESNTESENENKISTDHLTLSNELINSNADVSKMHPESTDCTDNCIQSTFNSSVQLTNSLQHNASEKDVSPIQNNNSLAAVDKTQSISDIQIRYHNNQSEREKVDVLFNPNNFLSQHEKTHNIPQHAAINAIMKSKKNVCFTQAKQNTPQQTKNHISAQEQNDTSLSGGSIISVNQMTTSHGSLQQSSNINKNEIPDRSQNVNNNCLLQQLQAPSQVIVRANTRNSILTPSTKDTKVRGNGAAKRPNKRQSKPQHFSAGFYKQTPSFHENSDQVAIPTQRNMSVPPPQHSQIRDGLYYDSVPNIDLKMPCYKNYNMNWNPQNYTDSNRCLYSRQEFGVNTNNTVVGTNAQRSVSVAPPPPPPPPPVPHVMPQTVNRLRNTCNLDNNPLNHTIANHAPVQTKREMLEELNKVALVTDVIENNYASLPNYFPRYENTPMNFRATSNLNTNAVHAVENKNNSIEISRNDYAQQMLPIPTYNIVVPETTSNYNTPSYPSSYPSSYSPSHPPSYPPSYPQSYLSSYPPSYLSSYLPINSTNSLTSSPVDLRFQDETTKRKITRGEYKNRVNN